MTKTDFAELKEKLCRKIYVDIYVQREHDSAIISELIDIIQSQSKCIEFLNKKVGSCAYSQIDKWGCEMESVYRSSQYSLTKADQLLKEMGIKL